MDSYSDNVAPCAPCAKCGARPPAGSRFCPNCGTGLGASAPSDRCAECGGEAPAGGRFCPHCGMPSRSSAYLVRPTPSGAVPARPMPQGAEASSNKYAWALALLPIPAGLLSVLLLHGTMADDPAAGCAFSIFFLGIQVVLLIADVKELKRGLNAANAHREIPDALWVLGGLLLMPAYLWRRARMSDGRYGPFAVSLCIALFGICAILVSAATLAQ